ncbi:hypothetical protein B296_00042978 [Ensete ventricosum]|uniref:Uncharacterized protein n=1 Tax=Ensete ventricosum TaxID=4639 RepID=A0A426XL09_ENSVE|nr:hypothetical protein B296_00042978 [Ensete ventricosum]
MQIPHLVRDMYTLTSKVLMARVVKALVLRLKDGCNLDAIVSAEQWATEAQVLANNLKTKLEEATRERETLEKELCRMKDELLKLNQAVDALRVDLPKQAIKEYKKSLGFEMGLVHMRQVSLEYGYQLTLAWLQARYPDIEIEEDPFTLLPENANVSMVEEQPFDDSSPPADG